MYAEDAFFFVEIGKISSRFKQLTVIVMINCIGNFLWVLRIFVKNGTAAIKLGWKPELPLS